MAPPWLVNVTVMNSLESETFSAGPCAASDCGPEAGAGVAAVEAAGAKPRGPDGGAGGVSPRGGAGGGGGGGLGPGGVGRERVGGGGDGGDHADGRILFIHSEKGGRQRSAFGERGS